MKLTANITYKCSGSIMKVSVGYNHMLLICKSTRSMYLSQSIPCILLAH